MPPVRTNSSPLLTVRTGAFWTSSRIAAARGALVSPMYRTWQARRRAPLAPREIVTGATIDQCCCPPAH